MILCFTTLLELYDREASRYHGPIYEKKRDELIAKLHGHLERLFQLQLKILSSKAITMFENQLLVRWTWFQPFCFFNETW